MKVSVSKHFSCGKAAKGFYVVVVGLFGLNDDDKMI